MKSKKIYKINQSIDCLVNSIASTIKHHFVWNNQNDPSRLDMYYVRFVLKINDHSLTDSVA